MSHRPRFIPVLLLTDRGLVKSTEFRDHRYLGDHLNAARIFSELGADELLLLDIEATGQGRSIDPEVVSRVSEELSMPLSVGGGISSVDQASEVIMSGAEKIVLCTGAWRDPYLIKEAAERHGSSAVCVCIDVKLGPFGKQTVHVMNGSHDTGLAPAEFARLVEEHGAGEILIQSIDNDGLMSGYDMDLVAEVANAVDVPVVALGGAGTLGDMSRAISEGKANAAAAGSMFVYLGPLNGVLINYPTRGTQALC
jgi:cyclase